MDSFDYLKHPSILTLEYSTLPRYPTPNVVPNVPFRPVGRWLALLISALVVYSACKVVYRLYFSPLSKFPGPKLAAATYLYEFYYSFILPEQLMTNISELHKKYGPIVRITPTELHVNDSEFAMNFCNNRKLDKDARNYRYGIDNAIISVQDHEEHRKRQQLILPQYTGPRLNEFAADITQYISKFNRRLQSIARPGSEQRFNFSWAIRALTTDIAYDFNFASPIGLIDYSDWGFSVHPPLFSMNRWLAGFRQFSAIYFLRKLLTHPIVQLFVPHSTPYMRILNMVQKTAKDQTTVKARATVHRLMEIPFYRNSISTNLIHELSETTPASYEGPAWLLCNIVYQLISHPAHIKTLRKELDSLGTGEIWTDSRIDKLPFLNALIKETLRLRSDVRRSTRVSNSHVIYKEHFIPAQTPISVTLANIGGDKALWPNPEKFDPYRWLHLNSPGTQKPFMFWGMGSRACVGREYSVLVVSRALACLFYNFDLSFVESTLKDTDFLTLFPPKSSEGLELHISMRRRKL